MLFKPLKSKFKKSQKGKKFNKIKVFKEKFVFGTFGLQTLKSCRLTTKQIITLYTSIKKKIKKKGFLIIRVFPHTPLTKKPIEVRMGKGKGNVDSWVVRVSAGVTLCEISTRYKNLALRVLSDACYKLPVKTKVIKMY